MGKYVADSIFRATVHGDDREFGLKHVLDQGHGQKQYKRGLRDLFITNVFLLHEHR